MKVNKLHSFDLSPSEARGLQTELAPRVVEGPPLDLGTVRYVAGADVSTQGDMAYATVVVLEFPALSVVEVQGFEARLSFPYVPGLLSFREAPPPIGALEEIRTAVDAISDRYRRPRTVPSARAGASRTQPAVRDAGNEESSPKVLPL